MNVVSLCTLKNVDFEAFCQVSAVTVFTAFVKSPTSVSLWYHFNKGPSQRCIIARTPSAIYLYCYFSFLFQGRLTIVKLYWLKLVNIIYSSHQSSWVMAYMHFSSELLSLVNTVNYPRLIYLFFSLWMVCSYYDPWYTFGLAVC